MTVACRSNDIVWGCYGANAVHMSMLQEFIACATGLAMGTYYQISNDWHIYEQHWPLLGKLPPEQEPYPTGHVALTNLYNWEDDLDNEYPAFIENDLSTPSCPYIKRVLRPMRNAWRSYKLKDKFSAMMNASAIEDVAVRKACKEWLGRRKWSEA
jgi:hypothetical protein